jgi:hypothetical protein
MWRLSSKPSFLRRPAINPVRAKLKSGTDERIESGQGRSHEHSFPDSHTRTAGDAPGSAHCSAPNPTQRSGTAARRPLTPVSRASRSPRFSSSNVNPHLTALDHIPNLPSHPSKILTSDLEPLSWHPGIHDPFRLTPGTNKVILVSSVSLSVPGVIESAIGRTRPGHVTLQRADDTPHGCRCLPIPGGDACQLRPDPANEPPTDDQKARPPSWRSGL